MASPFDHPDHMAFLQRSAYQQVFHPDQNPPTSQEQASFLSQNPQQPEHAFSLPTPEGTIPSSPDRDSAAPMPDQRYDCYGEPGQPSSALSIRFSINETLLDRRLPMNSHQTLTSDHVQHAPVPQHLPEDIEQQDLRNDYEQRDWQSDHDEQAYVSQWLAAIDAGSTDGSLEHEVEVGIFDQPSIPPPDPIFEEGPFWSVSDFRWSTRSDLTQGDGPFWDSREEFVAHFNRVQTSHTGVEKLLACIVGHYRAVDDLDPKWQHNMTNQLAEDVRDVVIATNYNEDNADIVIPHLSWTPPIEQMVAHLDYVATKISSAVPQDTNLTADEVLRVKTHSCAVQLDFYQLCANLAFIKLKNIVFKQVDAVRSVELADYERDEFKSLTRVVDDIFGGKVWPAEYTNPTLKAMAAWTHGLALRRQRMVLNYSEYPKVCLEMLTYADHLRRQQRESVDGAQLCHSTAYIFSLARIMLSKLGTDLYSSLRPGTEIPLLTARVIRGDEAENPGEKPHDSDAEEVNQPAKGKKRQVKAKNEPTRAKPEAARKKAQKRKRKDT